MKNLITSQNRTGSCDYLITRADKFVKVDLANILKYPELRKKIRFHVFFLIK